MPPTFGNGKICYLEIPATDVRRSAEFYAASFDWRILPEITAHFRDPAGNVFGIYQHPRG